MMSNKDILSRDDELCKFNVNLNTARHELWRIEEKCRIKKKSIEQIEYATKQSEIKNVFIEKQLKFTKSKVEEVRDSIVCMDKMIISLYDTLAHLEVQYDKRVFSINKSKNEYELQLFLKTELCRKEEERLNNIPEIKSINMANSELENIKFEFEELLKHYEDLKEKIAKAEEENYLKQKDIVVQFVTLYIENQSLDEDIENDKTILRKLKAEYHEKLNMKNALLESQKNVQFYSQKNNKASYWTQIPCLLDSKMLDIQIDSLNDDLNSSSNYDISLKNKSFVMPLTSSNKKPKNEDEILGLNDNTHLPNNVISLDLPSIKINQLYVNVDQCSKNTPIESKTIDFENNKKLVNEDNFDCQIKKRKLTEIQSDFEFKKPSNLLQEQIQDTVNNSIINSKNIQPHKKDKNIHTEINHTEHKSYITSFNESAEQSVVTNTISEKTKIFDLLQVPYNDILSTNNIRSLSDLCNDDDPDMDCSKTSSLFDPEFFEIYKSTYSTGQHKDVQSNTMSMLNGNGIFQQSHNESDTNSHTPLEETTSNELNNLNEFYQPHFMSSDLLH